MIRGRRCWQGYNLFAMALQFEWHRSKAEINLEKHGVGFEEARTIFGDPDEYMIRDPDHSWEEDRFISIGRSDAGRLLLVCYTQRDTVLRIISARRPERSEVEKYRNAR